MTAPLESAAPAFAADTAAAAPDARAGEPRGAEALDPARAEPDPNQVSTAPAEAAGDGGAARAQGTVVALHARGQPGRARADPKAAPAPAPVAPGVQPPGGRTLARVLLERGDVDPGALIQALEQESRGAARLIDVLLREGWIDPAAALRAQADLWGVRTVEASGQAGARPDARLIDAIGAGRCAALGVVPWRRAGGAVVVATARPEEFTAHRPELEAALGPVAMALTSEAALHDALRASRGGQLRALAEGRSPPAQSCRGDLLIWLRRWVLAGLAGLALGAALAPGAMLAGLAGWAVLMMVLFTGLKVAAAVAALRATPDGDGAGFGAGPLQAMAWPAVAQGGAEAPQAPRPTIARLPVVSILVALHGEGTVAPRLVQRLGRLAWPRGQLDVVLVVEEDDLPTRSALQGAALPPWVRVIAVPPGGIRTKPRALNYALDHCRGSVIGILDAEDAPDPDQIHQVVRRFHARGAEVACLQGVLGYYNAAENWLSRCFAVEYATWFRLVLPGLARLGLVVPLGGTTVYFRREALERVGAWDAHNVTEDADLGLRLARHGYRTELIAAETGEEATCRPLPWVRQRSRWIKGFAITYATHMRSPRALWRDLGAWRFLGVQVLFLSTLTQALLAPVLWSFWALALGLGHPLEGTLGLAGLVALTVLFLTAEAVNIALGMLAVAQRRGLRWLRVWVPTLHLYHPMATLAGLKALWEVIAHPLYWDKTPHGRFDSAAPPPLVFAGVRRQPPGTAGPTAAAAAPAPPGPRAAAGLPPASRAPQPPRRPPASVAPPDVPDRAPPLARTPPHGHGSPATGRTPPPRKEPPMATRQDRTEERIAHLERTAEDLSDEIARQSRQLAAIQRQLARLTDREAEREAEAGTHIPLGDQRPPHW